MRAWVRLHYFEEIISQAEDHIWFMTDQSMLGYFNVTIPDRKLTLRAVLIGIEPEDHEHSYRLGDNVEHGFLDGVKVGTAMNEKRAFVVFSDLKGRVDISTGFSSNTTSFHKWCNDLFIFSWERSRKRSAYQLKRQSFTKGFRTSGLGSWKESSRPPPKPFYEYNPIEQLTSSGIPRITSTELISGSKDFIVLSSLHLDGLGRYDMHR